MEHTYSFYVVDNLRYMQDDQPFLITDSLALDAAIDRYKSLPDTQVKALGANIDEIRSLDLVHCRPAEPGEVSGQTCWLQTISKYRNGKITT